MTTSDLITLLKENEFGGATGKPREVNLKIPGYGFITDLDFSVNSIDDGLYTAICFDVDPGTIKMDDENYDGDFKSIIDELEEEIHQAEYFGQDFRDSVSVWTLKRAVELLKLYKSKLS